MNNDFKWFVKANNAKGDFFSSAAMCYGEAKQLYNDLYDEKDKNGLFLWGMIQMTREDQVTC